MMIIMIHSDYKQFWDSQVHLKATSKTLMFNKLKIFPKPDGLTASWFRKRVKSVAPSTARYDKTLILQVLSFLEREEQAKDIRGIKLPKIEPAVTVEDLYTKDELERMFSVSVHPRDRAILQVLYESATRISELLSMTFENTTFNEDGTASIIVSGKTGTRSIPLFASVPILRDWLNLHPKNEGPIWVSFRSPYKMLPRPRVYTMVKGVLKKAKVTGKKNLLHMFRHTRLTELVRLGVRGQTLWKIAGWKSGKMELVYIHLSTADVENEVRTKVFGLKEDEDRYEPLMRSQKCPRCDEVNEPSARYCVKCNMPVSEDALLHELKNRQTDSDRIKSLEDQLDKLWNMLLSKEDYAMMKHYEEQEAQDR